MLSLGTTEAFFADLAQKMRLRGHGLAWERSNSDKNEQEREAHLQRADQTAADLIFESEINIAWFVICAFQRIEIHVIV